MTHRDVVQDLRAGRVVQSNAAAIGHPQEFAEAGRWVNVVIVVAAFVVADDQMIACLNVDAIVKIRHATVAHFDIRRRLGVEQTVLADRHTVSREIRAANRVLGTIEHDVAGFDSDALAVRRQIVREAIIAG